MIGVSVVESVSLELLSLQELSELRASAEAGVVVLSESELSALMGEIRDRWAFVLSFMRLGGCRG